MSATVSLTPLYQFPGWVVKKISVKIPALPGGAFLKQPQFLRPFLPLLMKPDVFLDHFTRYFVSNRSHKVTVLPELSTP